ncbi:unnamed protein product [Orchesella dallaii]|uniref:Uncharacterized protein n=1 Tax=Orchesella dallaii TaxID=48710 RepID=A0ABP1RLG7_9HEXA
MVSRILAVTVGIVVLVTTMHITSGDHGSPTSCGPKFAGVKVPETEPELVIQDTVGDETIYRLLDDALNKVPAAQVLYRRPRSEAGLESIIFEDPDHPTGSDYYINFRKVKEHPPSNKGTARYIYMLIKIDPDQIMMKFSEMLFDDKITFREPGENRGKDEVSVQHLNSKFKILK